MVFFVEGQGQSPNPVIPLRSGERIRLVLKNDAQGLLHDLAIPAWNVAVEEIRAGETAETTFVVPDTPGRFEYSCRPHSAMMSGEIEVTR